MTLDPGIHFGYIPPLDRTREELEYCERIEAALIQPFRMVGPYKDERGKFALWKVAEKAHGGRLKYNWQVTGSCFPAGTPVRMADGTEKVVEDVQVGDAVLTHTGRSRQVVETMRRDYSGNMVTVHVRGFPFPLTMTADHKLAVMRNGSLEWVRASDLDEGDRLILGWNREEAEPQVIDTAAVLARSGEVMHLDDLMTSGEAPVSRTCVAVRQCERSGADWNGRVKLVRSQYQNALKRYVPVCPSLARLVGLYLAEGGTDEGRVVFSFAADEADLCLEVLALVRGLFGVEGETFISNERGTCRKVRFTNINLAAFFREFVPGNVYSKRVPAALMRADEPTRTALLVGWLAGDGYAAPKKLRRGRKNPEVRIQGTTASPDLARDMTTLALSCGIRAACSKRKARKHSREAYDVYLSGRKAVSLYPALVAVREAAPRNNDGDSARCQFGYCRRITRIDRTPVAAVPVYDFEVEEDHSFIAGGVTSSNCVGASGGNAAKTRQLVEIALGDMERFAELWWPWTYGQSRKRAGLPGPGEGSFGAAYADAAAHDGFFAMEEHTGLTLPEVSGWLQTTKAVELEWSNGAAKAVEPYVSLGKRHPFRSLVRIRTPEEAKAAIAGAKTPLIIASMFGTRTIKPQGSSPPVNIAEYDDRWPHQMYIDEAWDHPDLGLIFRVGNNWGACYDRDTEVLTDQGWCRFDSLPENVRVATLDPTTHTMEFQAPTARMAFDYMGTLTSFRSRHIDLLVTPNHNVYASTVKGGWRLVRADECPNRVRMKKDAVNTNADRETYTVGGYAIPMDDWLEFVGYFVAEGYCGTGRRRKIRRKRAKRGFVRVRNGEEQTLACPETWESGRQSYTVAVSQVKPEGVEAIGALLARLPFNFRRISDGWSCDCKELWQELRALGSGAGGKRLPAYFRDLSQAQARVLLAALMVGDGTVKEHQQVYYTSSKQLADEVQELLLLAGFAGDIGVTDRVGRDSGRAVHRLPEYRIGINRFHCVTGPDEGFAKFEVPYIGKVYCLTVPNHTLYVRRNGKPCWSGNSAHPQPSDGESPPGGFYIVEGTLKKVLNERNTECFALGDLQGLVSKQLDWTTI